MIRALAIVMLGGLLAGCSGLEATVMFGPRQVDGVVAPGAYLMLAQRFGERGICAYTHASNPAAGRPFNSRAETNDDMLGCGWTWRGDRR